MTLLQNTKNVKPQLPIIAHRICYYINHSKIVVLHASLELTSSIEHIYGCIGCIRKESKKIQSNLIYFVNWTD